MAEAPRPRVPVLVFDGRCGFCTRAADWVRRNARTPLRVVPGQAADLGPLGLTEADVEAAAWYFDEQGRRHRGHRAMARAFAHCGGLARWFGLALERPGLAPFAAAGYALAARSRRFLPGATPACRDPESWPEACRERSDAAPGAGDGAAGGP